MLHYSFDRLEEYIMNDDITSLQQLSLSQLEIRDMETAQTLLHIAAEHGNIDIVKLFLDKELSLSAYDAEGYFPIHRAAEANRSHIIKLFIENQPATINQITHNRDTPLDLAMNIGAIESVIYMIEAGDGLYRTQRCYSRPLNILLNNNPHYKETYFKDFDFNSYNITDLIKILRCLLPEDV